MTRVGVKSLRLAVIAVVVGCGTAVAASATASGTMLYGDAVTGELRRLDRPELGKCLPLGGPNGAVSVENQTDRTADLFNGPTCAGAAFGSLRPGSFWEGAAGAVVFH